MNRVEIKNEAKARLKGHLWDFWKVYIIVVLLSALFGAFSAICDSVAVAIIISILYSIISIGLSFGALYYCMNIVREKDYSINDLWKYMYKILPIIVLSIITSVFIILWSILFIIPGIIATYSYIFASQIMIDDDLEPMECIKKSKKITYGHKAEYFVFQLSFIGWMLLGSITFGIAYIWVLPYYQFADIIWYDNLRKLDNEEK